MNQIPSNPLPIASLSLNPAIDLTYEVDQLKHDQKSRATASYYDPGGTGINVGIALEKLNANAHTCCITAGKMGTFLSLMLKQQLKNVYTIQVEGETRINTTILQQTPAHQYEINAAGPFINSTDLAHIINEFLRRCQQGIGILTGSLPPGVTDDTYAKINLSLQKQGGRAIIDAPVNVLRQALNTQPFMIKPNHHELEILCDKKLFGIEQIAHEARILVNQGISYVCISLGEKGAVLTGPENSYYCSSPIITVHSTVGAGDSMVAGLAHAFAQKKEPNQALKLATACGAGTAKQAGTTLFNPDEIEQLMAQIDVRKLDI